MQFKLQDMHDKEDQKDKISIQLSCTNLNFSILHFFKYSHYAQEKYFSNAIINEISEEIQNIDKKYHFSKKSLETFIRLIEDEETIICNEDYFDLYKLSEIFQIHPLQKILQKYAKNNSNEIDFIINLIKHKETTNDELFNNDAIFINGEEILQDKIEECLLNKQFKELPISIIYRIIEKSKFLHSNLLYDFIIESIEERCTLLHFIDVENLSESKFDELYKNYKIEKENGITHYYQYLPNDINYINKLKNDKKILEKRILELEQKNNQIQTQNDVKINKLIEENKELQAKIIKIEKENSEAQTNIKNKLQMKINEILDDNRKQKEQIGELKKQIENNKKILKFDHNQNDEFNGIMRYLTKITHSNIHENQTIEITTNSLIGNSWHPKNLVDFEDSGSNYRSNDEGGAIVCFDFKEKSINLKSYSIKSYRYGKNFTNLRNWVIEVSNDNQYWVEIDNHENDPTLNGANIIATFEVKKPNNNFYRFIRLRQTGQSWNARDKHNYIWFTFMEFYGSLNIPS